MQYLVLGLIGVTTAVLFLVPVLSYLPKGIARPVLALVTNQKLMLVFKISFVVMLCIFASTFEWQHRGECEACFAHAEVQGVSSAGRLTYRACGTPKLTL